MWCKIFKNRYGFTKVVVKSLLPIFTDRHEIKETKQRTEIFAEARLFVSAERRRDVGLVVGVDEDSSGEQLVSHVQSFVDVPSEDTGSQSVLRTISTAQNSIYVSDKHINVHFVTYRLQW